MRRSIRSAPHQLGDRARQSCQGLTAALLSIFGVRDSVQCHLFAGKFSLPRRHNSFVWVIDPGIESGPSRSHIKPLSSQLFSTWTWLLHQPSAPRTWIETRYAGPQAQQDETMVPKPRSVGRSKPPRTTSAYETPGASRLAGERYRIREALPAAEDVRI